MTSASDRLIAAKYADARRYFANHQLLHASTGRISTYAIGKPTRSEFYAEIYVGCGITVQGDIDLVSFVGGPTGHVAKLHWLATSYHDYAQKKAAIGMTDSGSLTTEYEPEDAKEIILDQRRHRGIGRKQARDTWDAIERCEPQENVHDALMAGDIYDAWELLPLGNVTSSRVINAHVAVQKLVELLGGGEG